MKAHFAKALDHAGDVQRESFLNLAEQSEKSTTPLYEAALVERDKALETAEHENNHPTSAALRTLASQIDAAMNQVRADAEARRLERRFPCD